MVIAIGKLSGKVYGRGVDRAAVLRKLHNEYPTQSRGAGIENIFPEPLKIREEE